VLSAINALPQLPAGSFPSNSNRWMYSIMPQLPLAFPISKANFQHLPI
jgi:hypothetical protein